MAASFAGSSPNRGLVFVPLRPYDERPTDAQSAQALVGRLFGPLLAIPGAIVIPILPPSIQGVGQFGLRHEGNPLLRYLMVRISPVQAVIFIKAIAVMLIVQVTIMAKKSPAIRDLIGFLSCVYLFAAILPWIYLLFYVGG